VKEAKRAAGNIMERGRRENGERERGENDAEVWYIERKGHA